MSRIKSTKRALGKHEAEKSEQEDRLEWDRLHKDLKDKKKWKKAEGADLEAVEVAVESLRVQKKRAGRPPSPKPFQGIHINLPLDLLDEIRDRAAKMNIGYQSYIKIALTKYLDELEKGRDEEI